MSADQCEFCGASEPSGHGPPCSREVSVRKSQRISFLERKLAATRADLLLKFEDEDDHGVADAAMDCRDIRNELKGLRFE